CRRPRELSPEERQLLFRYCFDHAVAQCASCSQDFRQAELGSDLLRSRTNLCPRCRVDLTERLREHLYSCTMLPEKCVEGLGRHVRPQDGSSLEASYLTGRMRWCGRLKPLSTRSVRSCDRTARGFEVLRCPPRRSAAWAPLGDWLAGV